jgi:predicted DNA-binding transcriptional regulator AlpA
MQPNCLLTTRQTADLIGISVSTLKRLRCAGTGPAYAKISVRTYRYSLADVEQWLNERLTGSRGSSSGGGKHG